MFNDSDPLTSSRFKQDGWFFVNLLKALFCFQLNLLREQQSHENVAIIQNIFLVLLYAF